MPWTGVAGSNSHRLEMPGGEGFGGEGEYCRSPAPRQNAFHHRHLQERAGRNRHRAMSGKLPLVQGEKAAGCRNAVDAAPNQLVGCRLERVEHVRPLGSGDLVRRSTSHDAVLHGKRPGSRVADVAVEALECGIEHQDADGDPVIGALTVRHGWLSQQADVTTSPLRQVYPCGISLASVSAPAEGCGMARP